MNGRYQATDCKSLGLATCKPRGMGLACSN